MALILVTGVVRKACGDGVLSDEVVTNYTTLSEVISTYWPILVCSFLVSLVATPLCRRFALRRNIVDRPDDWLKPHGKPIPYLGGVAVFLGWAAGVLLALALFAPISQITPAPRGGPSMNAVMMGGVLVAGLAIMLLGLFDDLRLASAKVKLAVQVLVTFWLIFVGLGDETILFAVRSTYGIQPWLILAYSIPLTLLITLGSCNATNLIDGMDGLCSGVLGIIAVGFLIIAVHLHLWGDWHPWDVQRVVLSLAMLGAALGFLPYNRNPAKIFMGDTGSMVLGLNVAIILLLFAKSSALRWLLGSVMVFGLPLADMLLTLVRRWRNQRPLMRGDRSHFYDQLLDRGVPLKRVVRISYALAAFFALMGCASILLRTRYIVPVYFLTALLVAAAVKKYGMVRLDTRPDQDDHPS
ncbi:MAG: undecaprenyl/decaprenyl-phosphate alpha-N-acetylglucosaminyl 1-phosphate transferase [Planctomycetes bacterium]|nr:undecaprenyl/decaprenyl-phosphate alpha-N-acetylglucosaminyl 1-phosphate transferase [Planctomycetota bacterium]